MNMEEDGNCNGFFFMNSNAMGMYSHDKEIKTYSLYEVFCGWLCAYLVLPGLDGILCSIYLVS